MHTVHTQIGQAVQQLHGVFYFTRDVSGAFQYVSSNMSHVLGYSEDEFLHHTTTYLTDDPVNLLVDNYSKLSCEGIQQAPYEMNVFHKDGSTRWLMVTETARKNEHGILIGVDGLALDITCQKQVQNALLTDLQSERQQFESKVSVQQETLKQTGRIRKLWKDTQRSYELEKKRYHAIIRNSFDAILILHQDGSIKGVNPAASDIFGWTAREFTKKNIRDIIPSIHCQAGCDCNCCGRVHYVTATHKNNQQLHLEVTPSLIKLRVETFLSVTIRDVSSKKEAEALKKEHKVRLESRVSQRTAELKHANQQLQDLANKMESLNHLDGLTCIYNRRGFEHEYNNEWQRAVRSHRFIAIIMIDIDHFKLYNDSYGHQAGDDCLKKVAATLANNVHRVGDVVCRYGGEEFVVVLPETPDAGVKHVAEKLRAAIEQLQIAHHQSPTLAYVTISLGLAVTTPKQGDEPKSLVKHADNALYQAKNSRNSFCLFEPD